MKGSSEASKKTRSYKVHAVIPGVIHKLDHEESICASVGISKKFCWFTSGHEC